MANQGVYISGLDECLECFDKMPERMLSATKQALREASKQTSKEIRQKVPPRFRRLVRYKVFTGAVTGDLNALIGLFNKKSKTNGSDQVDDWFKAYWKNYGTLQRRDPTHHFEYPVRNKPRRRNNVGQYSENFFEQAVPGWEGRFYDNFSRALAEQENRLVGK